MIYENCKDRLRLWSYLKILILTLKKSLLQDLKEAGYEVTQATVSRDIREMKLTKIATEKGNRNIQLFLM